MSHPAPQTLQTGVVFAADGAKQRSSTVAAKNVLTAALQSLASEDATHVQQERQWRTHYPRYFKAWVEGALVKPKDVARSAQSALSAAMDSLCWASGGQDIALSELLSTLKSERQASRLDVKTLVGSQAGSATLQPLAVPYKGQLLSGQALAEQARRWAVKGLIESSAAQAIIRCAENPQWFDLSDRTLVLLGAGSEAGPLKVLSQWKANIVAIDLPRPHVWARIAAIVEGGNSTVHVPLSRDGAADWTARAGADLLTELPEIARWMRGFKGPLDVAAHGYADGEKHLRLAAAMDVLQALACHDHEASTLAFMATPTDVYAVPQGAAAASMARYRDRPLLSKALQHVLAQFTAHRFFRPNVEAMVPTPSDAKYAVVDSLVIQQGPNYALAKRLQQWRGLVARSAGHRVSINVAPPTETSSVLSNRAIAAGYKAADVFGVEVFQPETTTALMAALWVHDLRTGNEADTASAPSAHPLDLIAQGACHGGFWSVAYCPRTALPFVAGLGLLRSALAGLKKNFGKGRAVGGLEELARAK